MARRGDSSAAPEQPPAGFVPKAARVDWRLLRSTPPRRERPDPKLSVRTVPIDRYRIRTTDGESVLTCLEAPTVGVKIKLGFSVNPTEARAAPPGTIFLDGTAQGEPFLDPKREVYNLDHHEGCVRSFTLATCEQAMVLLRRGLDLRKRDWTVYANDPDLDTVLAIWILLNHIRLNDEQDARARVMPLVRLQGIIDAQGIELEDLCALPNDLFRETRAWIDELRERELQIKATGKWASQDPLEYTADRLRAIDRLIYPLTHFDDVADIEELARAEIANNSVAIVCRTNIGIYETERQLRRLHGARLGVIALERAPSTYSLRQADPYLPGTLDDLYTDLNLIDSAAGGRRSPNRWGGSAEIGGSPRATGTRLTPKEIAAACQRAYGTVTLGERLRQVTEAALVSIAVVLSAVVWSFALGRLGDRYWPAFSGLAETPTNLSGTLLAIGAALFCFASRGSPGRYGHRRLSGFDWLVFVPLGAIGALAGGVWIPAVALPTPAAPYPGWSEIATLVSLPLGTELVFRGLVHGNLVTRFPIQRGGGHWFLSWPAVISAAWYAAASAAFQLPALSFINTTIVGGGVLGPVLGASVFGVAAAMARERSESVWAPILMHWLCIAAVLPTYARWV